MGIPKFGKWFIKTFPSSKIDKCQVQILCIDANSMLHKVASYIFAYHQNAKNEEKEIVISNSFEKNMKNYIYSIFNHIVKISNQTNADDVLFFVDGSVCMAKIMQQRSRRYISQKFMYRDQLLFNTNDISPGTPFMIKFHEMFQSYLQYNTKNLKFRLIYSSYLDPGEGEHKFIDYVRNNNINNKTIGLVGLDADLFMLGSIIHTYNNNVYLFRDNVYLHLSRVWNDLKFTEDNIKDFIYAFFLIGNDFVPSMIYFQELDNNLNILWNTFYNFIKLEGSVRKNFDIFLKKLQSQENYLLMNFYKQVPKDANQFNSLNQLVVSIKVLSTSQKFIKNDYKIDTVGFRNLFYSNLINVDNNVNKSVLKYTQENNLEYSAYIGYKYDDIDEINPSPTSIISSVLKNYVFALNWTYCYYVYGNVDYNWYPLFRYAPLLPELYNNYNNLNNLDFNKENIDPEELILVKNRKHFLIDEQLKLIMPPNYSKEIKGYGPFDIIKDVNFFSNESSLHNFIVSTPYFPVDNLITVDTTDPDYKIYFNKFFRKTNSILPTPTVKENIIKPLTKNEVLKNIPLDELNILFENFIKNIPNKKISLNTNLLTTKTYNAKYIYTLNNLQMYIDNSFYVLLSTNGNCELEYDDYQHTLIKDKFSIIKINEYIMFNTNNIQLIMFPILFK